MVVLLLTGKLQKPGKLSKVPSILKSQLGNAGLAAYLNVAFRGMLTPCRVGSAVAGSARGIDGGLRRFTEVVPNAWGVRRGALSPSLRLHWPPVTGQWPLFSRLTHHAPR